MLRDFVYSLNSSLIVAVLKQFQLDLPSSFGDMALIEFKLLTPDSFIWRFLISGSVYYLYAEDYVEGLDDIYSKLNAYIKGSPNIELIKARKSKMFEDAGPVKSATVYAELDKHADMMEYAVDSGYDFAFLCKSDEKADDAYFND